VNVFATSSCPVKSAAYLDDQRVVKMAMESCQMLSTVAAAHGLWRPGFAQPTHPLHPCVLWTAAGRDNWDWLYDHMWELDLERRRRWNRVNVHRMVDAAHVAGLVTVRKHLQYGGTPFVNAARNDELGLDFTHLPVHQAYRAYLRARWRLQARTGKRLASCTIQGMYHDRDWRS